MIDWVALAGIVGYGPDYEETFNGRSKAISHLVFLLKLHSREAQKLEACGFVIYEYDNFGPQFAKVVRKRPEGGYYAKPAKDHR